MTSPIPQDQDRWEKVSKAIWILIPLLAFFLIGFLSGSYVQGQVTQDALLNPNITLCQDKDGQLWLKETAQQNNFDTLEIKSN